MHETIRFVQNLSKHDCSTSHIQFPTRFALRACFSSRGDGLMPWPIFADSSPTPVPLTLTVIVNIFTLKKVRKPHGKAHFPMARAVVHLSFYFNADESNRDTFTCSYFKACDEESAP